MDDELQRLLANASVQEREALIAAARRDCWLKGDLRFKLDRNQLDARSRVLAAKSRRFVFEAARRIGKSYLLCCLAIEQCLAKPRSRVVYGAPSAKEVAEIIVPLIDEITLDAPSECKPVYSTQSGHYEFPNGSLIVLFGCEDKRRANRGRGPGADLVIVDEAGFIPILSYVLHSVLNPQTLTTGGRTVIASTPAEEPEHDFTRLAEAAEARDAYLRRTIYDNPRLSKAVVDEFIEDEAQNLGMARDEFLESGTFKREYLAERAVDKTSVVVPEWEAARAELVEEIERPPFFDAFTVLDMGGADPHAVLFGYWHFERCILVIEDEILLRDGENTEELAIAIKEKERTLWGTEKFDGTLRALDHLTPELLANLPDHLLAQFNKDAPRQPYCRWADNDVQMIRDLYALNGLAFIPTRKDEKQWAVNNLRIMLRRREVRVHPRCRNLDRHLRTTVWANERRDNFRRKNDEHGDLVDALVYGARNVDRQRNPYPDEWRAGVDYSPVVPIGRPSSQTEDIAEAFMGSSPLARKLRRVK